MKYELDISNAKEMKYSDRVKNFKYPCKDGEHQLAYDFIECDIPKDIFEEFTNKPLGNLDLFPLGFSKLLVGMTLTRIE